MPSSVAAPRMPCNFRSAFWDMFELKIACAVVPMNLKEPFRIRFQNLTQRESGCLERRVIVHELPAV